VLQEKTTSTSSLRVEETRSREEISQVLKAAPPKHPALNRVHARLISSSDTEIAISTYDRMHHRHSRS
jgi:hypothetical protein